jgi:hypothetical protein
MIMWCFVKHSKLIEKQTRLSLNKVRYWPTAVIGVHTCYQSAVGRKAAVQKASF